MGFVRKTISVDEKIWEAARRLISEELNLTMSKFIEMQLRTLVRSHNTPMTQMMGELIEDFMHGNKGKKLKEVKKK